MKALKAIFVSLCFFPLIASCSANIDDNLKVSLSNWPGYEYLWLAKENGYLNNHDFVAYTDLSEATLGYLRGEVDVAQLTTIDVAGICSKTPSKCPTIILVLNESLGGDKLMAMPGLSVKQLKGKTVGVSTNSFGPYILARALEKSSVSFTDVTLKPMQLPDMPKALRDGKVDAIALYPPYSEKASTFGAQEIFDSSQIPGEILDVLVVSPDISEEQTDNLIQLIDGWVKAHRDVMTNPSKYIPLMAEREGLDQETFNAILGDLKFLPNLADQKNALSQTGQVYKNVSEVRAALESFSLIQKGAPLPSVSNLLINQSLNR